MRLLKYPSKKKEKFDIITTPYEQQLEVNKLVIENLELLEKRVKWLEKANEIAQERLKELEK